MNILDEVTIIKVGTSSQIAVADDGSDTIDYQSIERIARQVQARQRAGKHTIIVSSGAIGAGMAVTGQRMRPSKQTAMPELQRLASIGWRHNLNAWDTALGDIVTGGILLTDHELNMHDECHEIVRVSYTMLAHGDVIIANENDVVSHSEIAIGDNDTLAARYAAKLAQSGYFRTVNVILLTDVDGLYQDIARKDSIIRVVHDIGMYEHLAGDAVSGKGTGGMRTKFSAARIACAAGVQTWITNSRADHAIERTLAGEIGTHFVASVSS